MKLTVVVAVFCLMVTMVTCQKKMAKKCKKLDKMAMKLGELKEMSKCPQIQTWSACEDGSVKVTYQLEDPHAEDCVVKPQEVMPCTKTETISDYVPSEYDSNGRKGCDITRTSDYSDCATTNKYEMSVTNPCKGKEKKLKKPCDPSRKLQKKMKKGFVEKLEKKFDNLQKACNDKEDMNMDKGNKSDKKAAKIARKKAKKAARREARRQRKNGQECKYRKGVWSDCDMETGTQSMERALKRGDPESCQPVQVIERPCKKKAKKSVCKYRRTQWSDCDGVTNVKRMVMTLKRGKPDQCDSTKVIEKICKRKHRGLRGGGCKYSRGMWSECDMTTGKQSMRKPLKMGNQSMCPSFKLVQRPCKGKSIKRAGTCKYRKNSRWGPCDKESNTKSRNMILVRGNPSCEQTKVFTKPCRQRSKKKGKCRYDKSQWGPCDAATNMVTRTLTLKDGDPTVCNTTRVDVRKCKDKHLRPHVCKYRRTTWGECDLSTNIKQMVKTLKRGDPSKCSPTEIIQKKCKKKNKGNVCKYRFQPWSPCINATNTMTRRQVLESGPSTCPQVKEYTKKCKKSCKFMNGEWSTCDPVSKQMTRTDILRPGSADYCNKTRVLSKKCGKKEKRCIYDYGEWSECDESDNPKRSRVQTLVSGGDNCDETKIVRKPCKKPSGEDRCFFGPWQEYKECQNGVQKKHRQVLQGGLECERKGVKMKSC